MRPMCGRASVALCRLHFPSPSKAMEPQPTHAAACVGRKKSENMRLSLLCLVAIVAAVPVEMVNSTSTLNTGMTLDDKQAAEADSAAADTRVSHLEKSRDEAWHNARGNLAVASSPPIRSSAVFALLSTETERFAVRTCDTNRITKVTSMRVLRSNPVVAAT